jgi:hypothetical protein
MCRNIRPLFNFEPATTPDEVRDAALQFVRKVSGFSKPSQANAPAFGRAVDEVSEAVTRLLQSLETAAPPKDREAEARKRRERSTRRLGGHELPTQRRRGAETQRAQRAIDPADFEFAASVGTTETRRHGGR